MLASSPASSRRRPSCAPRSAHLPGPTDPKPFLLDAAIALAAALGGIALLAAFAPGYLTQRGFPLDDAWIHAVYGRELARTGLLAYNPGAPATGATSPLWAALLAIPHLWRGSSESVVLAIKLMGLGLHVTTAMVAARVIGGPPRVVRACAVLLVLYPPLLAASVSGMEIPLATLLCAALLAALRSGSAPAYGIAAVLAPLARPELGALVLALPAFAIGDGRGRCSARCLWAVGGLGLLLGAGGTALRNLAASGKPLPATFYAKVRTPLSVLPESLARGFWELMGVFPLTELPLVVVGSALGVAALASRGDAAPRPAAAAWFGGVGLCALSFALVPPIDPAAFYHQRYALPGAALLVAALPALGVWAIDRVGRPSIRKWASVALAAVAGAGLALDLPGRLRHLENDARNIDDVQVAVGKSLATTSAGRHVWAVDAGAVRYFGAAFVVDMLGLNTPEVVAPAAAEYLAAHPPHYLELVPGWSSVIRAGGRQFAGTPFTPSTTYTVTSFPPMQMHFLAACPPTAAGIYAIRGRRYPFECADGEAGEDRDPSVPGAVREP